MLSRQKFGRLKAIGAPPAEHRMLTKCIDVPCRSRFAEADQLRQFDTRPWAQGRCAQACLALVAVQHGCQKHGRHRNAGLDQVGPRDRKVIQTVGAEMQQHLLPRHRAMHPIREDKFNDLLRGLIAHRARKFNQRVVQGGRPAAQLIQFGDVVRDGRGERMRLTSQMREEDPVNDVDMRKPVEHFPLKLRFGRHRHGASNIVERCINPLLVLH